MKSLLPAKALMCWRYFPAVVAAIVTLAAALVPHMHHPYGDKTEHVLAFALLGYVLSRPQDAAAKAGKILLGLAAFALVIELAQMVLSPSRYADLSDFVASVVGSVSGIVIAWLRPVLAILSVPILMVFALGINKLLNS